MPKKGQPLLLYLLAVAGFGLLVPWSKGFDFFDPLLIVPYGCLAWVFAAPVGAATEPESARATRSILIAAAYGWLSSVLILAIGIATVNSMSWHGWPPVLPSTGVLSGSLALGLSGALLVAAATTLLRKRGWSAEAARLVLRTFLILTLLGFALGSRMFPGVLAKHMTSRELPPWLFGISAVFLVASLVLMRAAGTAVPRSDPA